MTETVHILGIGTLGRRLQVDGFNLILVQEKLLQKIDIFIHPMFLVDFGNGRVQMMLLVGQILERLGKNIMEIM